MIKSVYVAMNDANATKFENEFDTSDNANGSTQESSGAFRNTDMVRKEMKIYEIRTDDAGFTIFFGNFKTFMDQTGMMAGTNLVNLNLNPLQNAYRIISDDSTHSADLAVEHGSGVATKITEIFTGANPMTVSINENSISDKDKKYDDVAISFANNDYSDDTISRLTKYCTFLDETATSINGGTAPDEAGKQKILSEKVGLSWINFYNLAKDQIARAEASKQAGAAQAEKSKETKPEVKWKKYAAGVYGTSVWTADGEPSIRRSWLEQYLNVETKQLIMDRADEAFSWDTTVYDAMTADGVSVDEINALIYSDATSAEDANAASVFSDKYWYGTADAKLRGLINHFQTQTRKFAINVSDDPKNPQWVHVFVDLSTEKVLFGDNTTTDDMQTAIVKLYQALPIEGDTAEYLRIVSAFGTTENYLNP